MIDWKLIKSNILNEDVLDLNIINSLTPNLLNDPETLLPHILEQVNDDNLIFSQLAKLGIYSFEYLSQDFNNEIIYVDKDFVLVNFLQNNQGIGFIVFLVNPLSELAIHNAYCRAVEFNYSLDSKDKIGIISRNNPLFLDAEKNALKSINSNNLIDAVIDSAIQRGVSDVHIAPRSEKYIFIKFRIFGDLLESGIDDVHIDNYQAVSNFLLIKSGKDPGLYSFFQEANFKHETNIGRYEVRLQANPLSYSFPDGRPMLYFIMRIHGGHATFRSIESIGILSEHISSINNVIKKPSGIVLVSGPTGSGKTTLLYAILSELQKLYPYKNIMTLEDPVEVVLSGMQQININKSSGIDFASGIKAILRSDADVAFVGEVRDEETANGLVVLDEIGHLVFATIHAKDSFAVINRLHQTLELPRQSIAESLSLIISARLIKRVCSECSEDIPANEDPLINKYAKYFNDDQVIIKKANPKGCNFCQKGYQGRLLVSEMFEIDEEISNMIVNNINKKQMSEYLLKTKNKNTMLTHGLSLVLEQKTTFDAISGLPEY